MQGTRYESDVFILTSKLFAGPNEEERNGGLHAKTPQELGSTRRFFLPRRPGFDEQQSPKKRREPEGGRRGLDYRAGSRQGDGGYHYGDGGVGYRFHGITLGTLAPWPRLQQDT